MPVQAEKGSAESFLFYIPVFLAHLSIFEI